jgi:hypothetical protein
MLLPKWLWVFFSFEQIKNAEVLLSLPGYRAQSLNSNHLRLDPQTASDTKNVALDLGRTHVGLGQLSAL